MATGKLFIAVFNSSFRETLVQQPVRVQERVIKPAVGTYRRKILPIVQERLQDTVIRTLPPCQIRQLLNKLLEFRQAGDRRVR